MFHNFVWILNLDKRYLLNPQNQALIQLLMIPVQQFLTCSAQWYNILDTKWGKVNSGSSTVFRKSPSTSSSSLPLLQVGKLRRLFSLSLALIVGESWPFCMESNGVPRSLISCLGWNASGCRENSCKIFLALKQAYKEEKLSFFTSTTNNKIYIYKNKC